MNARGVDNGVGSTPASGSSVASPMGGEARWWASRRSTRVVGGVERADPHGLKVRWP